MTQTIMIDGRTVAFEEGQTIMEAAIAADVYILHLCHNPNYEPHGSCKLCTVKVNGRNCTACTFPAQAGQVIENQTETLNQDRKRITQMLFVEGNHFCPSCEKTGNCQLQGVGYYLKMQDNHFPHFFANREVDASHPDVLIDHNRCIFCSLCVRSSQVDDGKDVFAIGGRGLNKRLIINSKTGKLKDSDLEVNDCAAHICPTGAILIKRTAYSIPIGERIYDKQQVDEVALTRENKQHGK